MAALTEKKIEALKWTGKHRHVRDGMVPGLFVQVRASKKLFVVSARDRSGKQLWRTVGTVGGMSLETARKQAMAMRQAITGASDDTGPATFFSVSRMWFRRHVVAKKLHTAAEIERTLRNHLSVWDDRPFESITRRDVANLLDKIEDTAGPAAADKTLATVSRICGWHQTRHDHYTSPVVRGMKRGQSKARDRILTDDEIRKLWAVTGELPDADLPYSHPYYSMIRMLLVTAQRREKVMTMHWSAIADGVWTVPHEDGQKGVGGRLELPSLALTELDRRPRLAGNDYVFAGRSRYFNGLSRAHNALVDLCGFHFTRRDLRRSARSLMARAGVPQHTAERLLGHVQGGVVGVYDRFSYDAEKADALTRLDGVLQSILAGDSAVVSLAAKRKSA